HPVIVGPITFVKLSKGGSQSFEEKVNTLLPLYKEVLQSLVDAGAEYIQIDEPVLVEDDSASFEDITRTAYNYFDEAVVSNHLVDRKSTRLNSSHVSISYAVFFLK